jgi:hypothetical protein
VIAAAATTILLLNSSVASAKNTALCKVDTSLTCPEVQTYTGHNEALAVKPELLSNLPT